MYSKLILSDCDGVMCDWEGDFRKWMQSRGHKLKYSDSYHLHHHFHDLEHGDIEQYVNEFCASDAIRNLSPYLDAQKYIEKLYKQHGYKFRVITSIGSESETRKRREQNLNDLFGDAIESVICLDVGAEKDLILEPYRGTGMFWIEDKYENFVSGLKLGLTSILVSQEYNKHIKLRQGLRAQDWRDIYKIITGMT